MAQLSRRTLLQGSAVAAGLTATMAAGPAQASPSASVPRHVTGLRPRRGRLADTRTLQSWVDYLADLGPRYTGTGPHARFIDDLAVAYRSLGFEIDRRPQTFQRWTARRYDLTIRTPGGGVVPVRPSFYYPYSGQTPSRGIHAGLVYAGTGRPADLAGVSVRGKVAVIDAPWADIVLDDLVDTWFGFAPGVDPTQVYNRAATDPLVRDTVGVLLGLKAAGAVGCIKIMPMARADAYGQYDPFDGLSRDIPAICVDAAQGDHLRAVARRGGSTAHLVLDAEIAPSTRTDGLLAMLPGARADDDVVVVNTHTDGPNVVEENGPLGMLSIGQRLAAVPRKQRPVSFAFYFATGHFAQTQLMRSGAYLTDYPDLAARTKAGVTVEHLGARGWADDGVTYRPTGDDEPSSVYCSNRAVAIIARAAIRRNRLTLCSPSKGPFYGEGVALDAAGIPMMSYLPGPTYLVAEARNRHVDLGWCDVNRMHTEIDTLHHMIHTAAATSRAALAR